MGIYRGETGDVHDTVERTFGIALDPVTGAHFRVLAEVSTVQKRLDTGELWDPIVVKVRLFTESGQHALLEGDVLIVFGEPENVRCKVIERADLDLLRLQC